MKNLYNFLYINKYIYFNPILIQLLLFIFYFSTIIITGDVYYCDDGLNPSNGENSSNEVVVYENNTNTWESNYQNQERSYGYQTHDSVGRPIYQAYNDGLQERSYGYQTHDSDGRAIYQAYNDGLQETSHGHRFELGGNSINQDVNQEPFIVELEGTQVYATYHSSDINGNPLYSYSSDGSTRIGFIEPIHSDGSTMVGIIEPDKTEVLGNGYYNGGPHWRIVDTSTSTFKRRCYNKVKTTINNHIAKSTKAASRERALDAEKYSRLRTLEKNMDASRKVKRYQDMYNGRPIKVRKWD